MKDTTDFHVSISFGEYEFFTDGSVIKFWQFVNNLLFKYTLKRFEDKVNPTKKYTVYNSDDKGIAAFIGTRGVTMIKINKKNCEIFTHTDDFIKKYNELFPLNHFDVSILGDENSDISSE